MDHAPDEPDERHVWVRPPAQHGESVPGLVISWHRAPVHNALASDWLALVATVPFEDGLVVSWVGAERLIPVRDARPVELAHVNGSTRRQGRAERAG